MRREFAALLCAAVLLLAGCQGLGTDGGASTATETEYSEVTTLELDGEELSNGSRANETEFETPLVDTRTERPDPETDRLGWENGYWHNESLNVTNGDGLNRSERAAVVNRSMARIERVRGLEFDEPVPVETVSRTELRANSSNGSYGDSLRAFDNAKFEALFLIGERESSIETQERTFGDSVLGYYSPSRDEIVIVTNSETPSIGERTLGHELVHALQDQQFGLENGTADTRDARQGRTALIEGDASTVETRYTERCGDTWECVGTGSAGGGGGPPSHWGIYFLVYFPYSDGSAFVSELYERGGWDAVDAAYDDKPDGAREVMTASEYPDWEPSAVTIPATPDSDWERVRPSSDIDRPDYATVGPSAIAAAQVYTLYDDYNRSSVIQGAEFFNYDARGRLDSADPLNYDLDGTRGWEGGRLQVYESDGETGYVWRTSWSDDDAAAEFASSWEAVVRHWGGNQTADGNWVIESESPFSDAIAVRVEGDTVTVVNAPTERELSELYDA